MRKFFPSLLVFLALYAAVVCACGVYSATTPTCPSEGTLYVGSLSRGCVLDDWRDLRQSDGSYRILLTGASSAPPMTLVLYDIGPFELFQDGVSLYHYSADQGYLGTHIVPLRTADALDLTLRSESVYTPDSARIVPAVRANTRLLLSTTEHAQWMDRLVLCVNAGTIGIYVLVIFYSLSLYAKKRSEHYLLLLCGLAVLALASSFTNSNLFGIVVGNLKSPIRYLRLLLCIALSVRLMGVRLHRRWGFLLTWPGMLLVTGGLFLLDTLGLGRMVDEVSYLSIIPCGIVCVMGLQARTPGALVLTIGTALREGIRLYHRLILAGVLTTSEFFYYFYIPQAYNLLFVLCCIIIVNGCFARKFCEADALAEQQKDLNQHLDGLVRARTEELKHANELLVETQQRKHRMMTNIFHDLRTPIFCAQGSAEMISATDDASAKRLDVLKDRLDYLAHMSQELFTLASIEERSDDLELFRIRSEVLCAPVAAAAQVQAEQSGRHFSSSIEGGLCFAGDAYRMKHALDNLLSNALKFTPAGGTVDFTVRAWEGAILFEVSDTGPGLTPEEQGHIFERSYSSGGFSGFGLPIAAAIAAAHHGEITVTSTPGAGAVFTIRLPLEPDLA